MQAYLAYQGRRHFTSLNGIRALCALAVIKEHVEPATAGPRLLSLGFLAVDFFFVLSGFLIVTLLLRERERTSTISLRQFYQRRALRIFPIYYFSIGAVLLFYLVAGFWNSNGLLYYLPAFPILALYLQNIIPTNIGIFYHFWSLGMEEQFYLLWPAIEKYVKGPGKFVALGLLFAVSQLSNYGLLKDTLALLYGEGSRGPDLPMYKITFAPILLGVLLAHVLHHPAGFQWLHRLLGRVLAPPLLVGLLVLTCELAPPDIQGTPRLAIHLLMTAFLACVLVRPDHLFRPLLENRVMNHIGEVSYGLYIYHVVVMMGIEKVFRLAGWQTQRFAVFVAVLLVSLAVARLSFRYLEQPFLRLKDRWTPGGPAPSAAGAPRSAALGG